MIKVCDNCGGLYATENFEMYAGRGCECPPEKRATTGKTGGVVPIVSSARLDDCVVDKFTLAKPCCVDGTPDAHTVWLKIGVQSFCIDGYQDTKEDADWMRKMLAKALMNFLLDTDKLKSSNEKAHPTAAGGDGRAERKP